MSEEGLSTDYQKNFEKYIKVRYPGHFHKIESITQSRKYKAWLYPFLFCLIVLCIFSIPSIILVVVASVDLGSLNNAITDEGLQMIWIGLSFLYTISTILAIIFGIGVGKGKSSAMLLEAESMEIKIRTEFSSRVNAIRNLLKDKGSYTSTNLWEEILLDDISTDEKMDEPQLGIV